MKYKSYTLYNYREIKQLRNLSEQEMFDIEVVGHVLPFKTNNYVVDQLIDWDNYKDDPMFILNFPQRGMLPDEAYNNMADAIKRGASRSELSRIAADIRFHLNPHPAGQSTQNIPRLNGELMRGMQHKYNETVLFFPTQGQTCHAYCTFCFRWPQFVKMDELKFAMNQGELLVEYIRSKPEITDVLFTGGDPMTMKASVFKTYIDLLLEADLPNLKTIRIGTKSLSFWPYRYITDNDAGEMLGVFQKIVDSGLHLAIMAHFNHHVELKTDIVKEAVSRIRKTGAIIRTQSPILRHINDRSSVWREMWQNQVELGMVPYYMFLARNTGAISYFSIPIVSALDIFRNAYSQISGICRTVRGPIMSSNPGKVLVSGITEINGSKLFVLSFVQGRDATWVKKPFFGEYDKNAVWLDDLKPAFDENYFFYQKEMEGICVN